MAIAPFMRHNPGGKQAPYALVIIVNANILLDSRP